MTAAAYDFSVSVHEVGHAVVGMRLGLAIAAVEIARDGSGLCLPMASMNEVDLGVLIPFTLAGPIAQNRHAPGTSGWPEDRGHGPDYECARLLVKAEHNLFRNDWRFRLALQRHEIETARLVEQEWNRIVAGAKALVVARRLSGEQLARLVSRW